MYILCSITLTLRTHVTSFGRVGRFAESGFELGRPIDQSTPAHDGAPKFSRTKEKWNIRRWLTGSFDGDQTAITTTIFGRCGGTEPHSISVISYGHGLTHSGSLASRSAYRPLSILVTPVPRTSPTSTCVKPTTRPSQACTASKPSNSRSLLQLRQWYYTMRGITTPCGWPRLRQNTRRLHTHTMLSR